MSRRYIVLLVAASALAGAAAGAVLVLNEVAKGFGDAFGYR